MPSQWSNISSYNETEVILLKYEWEDYSAWCPESAGCPPPRVLLPPGCRRMLRQGNLQLSSTISWAASPRASSAGFCPIVPGLNKQLGKSEFVLCAFLPFIPSQHHFAKWRADTWTGLLRATKRSQPFMGTWQTLKESEYFVRKKCLTKLLLV